MVKREGKPFELFMDKVYDGSVSPWDAYRRPDKPVEEFTRREVGLDGERLAYLYLARRGFEMVECNWRAGGAEADIVCTPDGETAVLVEVKTRLDLNDERGVVPELNVTPKKQERYRRLALMYLADHPEYSGVRFDVVAITITGQRTGRLRHLCGAFCVDES